MAAKKTYWMHDGYGTVALVEGADERDRWKPLGWVDSEPPGPGSQVWMRHETHGGRAKFPFASVELWRPRGWSECEPPPVADPFSAETPADVVEPVAVQVSEPASPAATKKEKADG
ncbi:hypothetical protein [Micromonospora sp. DT229]|uniref:hypothetical protein n=1 Tax=Micromonospora sp. DT229 TaxID=3393430 RepID=UPI003CEFE104